MLTNCDKLFERFNITTGAMANDSGLISGPMVDKTLFDDDFPEYNEEVIFVGARVPDASSVWRNGFNASIALISPSGSSFWLSKDYEAPGQSNWTISERLWFKFHSSLVLTEVEIPTKVF